jgi:hypothetical protein
MISPASKVSREFTAILRPTLDWLVTSRSLLDGILTVNLMLLRRSSGEFDGDRDTVTDEDGFVLARAGVATPRRGLDMTLAWEGITLPGNLVSCSRNAQKPTKMENQDQRYQMTSKIGRSKYPAVRTSSSMSFNSALVSNSPSRTDIIG